MIREVRALGLETCATLGMLTPQQAGELKDAGPRLLQPQRRQLRRLLQEDHHHAHLPAPARHARGRAQCEPQGLQRRHRRHGRDAHRSRRHAGDAGEPAGASAERADQPARAGEGHAAGRRTPAGTQGRRWLRVRAHHCGGAHPDAAGAGAPLRRPRGDVRRTAGAGVHGRRELDLLRREAADHRQSRRRARPRAARAPEDQRRNAGADRRARAAAEAAPVHRTAKPPRTRCARSSARTAAPAAAHRRATAAGADIARPVLDGRELRQLLQQRLPRASRAIRASRTAMARGAARGAPAPAPRTWSPATRASTTSSRKSWPPSPAAKPRCCSRPATWRTSA